MNNFGKYTYRTTKIWNLWPNFKIRYCIKCSVLIEVMFYGSLRWPDVCSIIKHVEWETYPALEIRTCSACGWRLFWWYGPSVHTWCWSTSRQRSGWSHWALKHRAGRPLWCWMGTGGCSLNIQHNTQCKDVWSRCSELFSFFLFFGGVGGGGRGLWGFLLLFINVPLAVDNILVLLEPQLVSYQWRFCCSAIT